ASGRRRCDRKIPPFRYSSRPQEVSAAGPGRLRPHGRIRQAVRDVRRGLSRAPPLVVSFRAQIVEGGSLRLPRTAAARCKLTLMRFFASLTICLALFSSLACAQEPAKPAAAQSGQFTFAWPLGEGMLKPRGATTRGAPVTLDTAQSREWQALR